MKRGLQILLAEIIFFSIFLLASCQKNPDVQGFINVDDEYEILISQVLTSEGGEPSLLIRSVELQECFNSYISYETITSINNTEIRINDIGVEGLCVSAQQVVEEIIELGLPVGSSTINISLRNIVDNYGSINYHDHKIELKLNSNDGLKVSKSTINRIQQDMRWGHFNTQEDESVTIINDYIDSIKKNSSVAKGDYGLFYLNQNDNLVDTELQEELTQSFIIYTDESFSDFQNMIESIKQNDPSLTFQATNYDGSTLNIQ